MMPEDRTLESDVHLERRLAAVSAEKTELRQQIREAREAQDSARYEELCSRYLLLRSYLQDPSTIPEGEFAVDAAGVEDGPANGGGKDAAVVVTVQSDEETYESGCDEEVPTVRIGRGNPAPAIRRSLSLNLKKDGLASGEAVAPPGDSPTAEAPVPLAPLNTAKAVQPKGDVVAPLREATSPSMRRNRSASQLLRPSPSSRRIGSPKASYAGRSMTLPPIAPKSPRIESDLTAELVGRHIERRGSEAHLLSTMLQNLVRTTPDEKGLEAELHERKGAVSALEGTLTSSPSKLDLRLPVDNRGASSVCHNLGPARGVVALCIAVAVLLPFFSVFAAAYIVFHMIKMLFDRQQYDAFSAGVLVCGFLSCLLATMGLVAVTLGGFHPSRHGSVEIYGPLSSYYVLSFLITCVIITEERTRVALFRRALLEWRVPPVVLNAFDESSSDLHNFYERFNLNQSCPIVGSAAASTPWVPGGQSSPALSPPASAPPSARESQQMHQSGLREGDLTPPGTPPSAKRKFSGPNHLRAAAALTAGVGAPGAPSTQGHSTDVEGSTEAANDEVITRQRSVSAVEDEHRGTTRSDKLKIESRQRRASVTVLMTASSHASLNQSTDRFQDLEDSGDDLMQGMMSSKVLSILAKRRAGSVSELNVAAKILRFRASIDELLTERVVTRYSTAVELLLYVAVPALIGVMQGLMVPVTSPTSFEDGATAVEEAVAVCAMCSFFIAAFVGSVILMHTLVLLRHLIEWHALFANACEEGMDSASERGGKREVWRGLSVRNPDELSLWLSLRMLFLEKIERISIAGAPAMGVALCLVGLLVIVLLLRVLLAKDAPTSTSGELITFISLDVLLGTAYLVLLVSLGTALSKTPHWSRRFLGQKVDDLVEERHKLEGVLLRADTDEKREDKREVDRLKRVRADMRSLQMFTEVLQMVISSIKAERPVVVLGIELTNDFRNKFVAVSLTGLIGAAFRI